MADYNFDIAFDWNVLPDSNGQLPLNIGLATFNQPPQLGTQYTFQAPTDSFCFNGFNQTSGATQAGYSITGGSITFRPAVDQSATSPIGITSLTISPLASTGTGPSDVFPGANYPNFCPVVPLLQVSRTGDFWFTVSLTVQQASDGTTKIFQVDPEMVVNSVG
jgi:hypothetical protein